MLKQAERSLIKLYIAIALSDFHIAPDRISTHHQVEFPHYTRSDRVDLVKGIREIFSRHVLQHSVRHQSFLKHLHVCSRVLCAICCSAISCWQQGWKPASPPKKKTPAPPPTPPKVSRGADPLLNALHAQLSDCTGEVQQGASTLDRDEQEHAGVAEEAEAFIEHVLEEIRSRSSDNKKRGGWFNKTQVLCEAILVGKPEIASCIAGKYINKSSDSYPGDDGHEWA